MNYWTFFLRQFKCTFFSVHCGFCYIIFLLLFSIVLIKARLGMAFFRCKWSLVFWSHIIEDEKVLNFKAYYFASFTISNCITNTFPLSTHFPHWANLHLQNFKGRKMNINMHCLKLCCSIDAILIYNFLIQ